MSRAPSLSDCLSIDIVQEIQGSPLRAFFPASGWLDSPLISEIITPKSLALEIFAVPPKKPRLLLAEDHKDTCDLLTLVLTQENYEILSSPSVAKAMELARNEKFDLMIIDSHLIDGSGLELCRAIRQYDDETPIMFYSGQAYDKDKQNAYEAGAHDYLVKPVDISMLVERLGRLLTNARTAPAKVRTPTTRKESGELQVAIGS